MKITGFSDINSNCNEQNGRCSKRSSLKINQPYTYKVTEMDKNSMKLKLGKGYIVKAAECVFNNVRYEVYACEDESTFQPEIGEIGERVYIVCKTINGVVVKLTKSSHETIESLLEFADNLLTTVGTNSANWYTK